MPEGGIELKSPSGRIYKWNKPTPPTDADLAELMRYDKSLDVKPQPKAQAKTQPYKPSVSHQEVDRDPVLGPYLDVARNNAVAATADQNAAWDILTGAPRGMASLPSTDASALFGGATVNKFKAKPDPALIASGPYDPILDPFRVAAKREALAKQERERQAIRQMSSPEAMRQGNPSYAASDEQARAMLNAEPRNVFKGLGGGAHSNDAWHSLQKIVGGLIIAGSPASAQGVASATPEEQRRIMEAVGTVAGNLVGAGDSPLDAIVNAALVGLGRAGTLALSAWKARDAAKFAKALSGMPLGAQKKIASVIAEGIDNASQIKQATEVHGPVQPQPGKGAEAVPTQGSGPGVRPEASSQSQASLKYQQSGSTVSQPSQYLQGEAVGATKPATSGTQSKPSQYFESGTVGKYKEPTTQPTAQAETPPKTPPTETKGPAWDQSMGVALQQRVLRAIRSAAGLGKVDVGKQSVEQWAQEAVTMGLDTRDGALAVARRINTGKQHSLSQVETIGMASAADDLANELARVSNEYLATASRGGDAQLADQVAMLTEQMDELTKAGIKSGAEQSRAFAARQWLMQDGSIAGRLAKLQKAGNGVKLTPKQIAEETQKVTDLQAAVAARDARIAELEGTQATRDADAILRQVVSQEAKSKAEQTRTAPNAKNVQDALDRRALMSLDPDSPQLDPFSDSFDENLAGSVQRVIGTDKPANIALREYQNAHAVMTETDRAFVSDVVEWTKRLLDTGGEGWERWHFDRKLGRWRRDARSNTTMIPVDLEDVPEIRAAIIDTAKGSSVLNDDVVYMSASSRVSGGYGGTSNIIGGKLPSGAFRASELVSRDGDVLIPAPVLKDVLRQYSSMKAHDTLMSEAEQAASRAMDRLVEADIKKQVTNQGKRLLSESPRAQKRSALRVKLDDEFNALSKQLMQQASQASAGINPEMLPTLGKMIRNRAQLGYTHFDEFAERFIEDMKRIMPDLKITKDDVRNAVAYGVESREKVLSDWQRLKQDVSKHFSEQQAEVKAARQAEAQAKREGIQSENQAYREAEKAQRELDAEVRRRTKELEKEFQTNQRNERNQTRAEDKRRWAASLGAERMRLLDKLDKVTEDLRVMQTEGVKPGQKSKLDWHQSDPMVRDLNNKIGRIKRDMRRTEIQIQENADWDALSSTQKFLRTMNPLTWMRHSVASFDNSFPMNQGHWLMLTNPKEWYEGVKGGFKSITEKGYDKVMEEIHANPNFDLWDSAGLFEQGVGKQDYYGTSSRISKVPGFKQSEQMYDANASGIRMRVADNWKDAMELAKGRELTPAELKRIATEVKAFSGQGRWGSGLGKGWANILLAPRYAFSQAEVALFAPIGRAWRAGDVELTKFLMGKYMRAYGVGLSTLVGLHELSEFGPKENGKKKFDVVINPFSTDFGRAIVRNGNTTSTVDILPPQMRLLAQISRIGLAQFVSTTGKESGGTYKQAQEIGQFITGKLHPAIGAARTAIAAQQDKNKEAFGETYDFKNKPGEASWNMAKKTLPISIQGTVDSIPNRDLTPQEKVMWGIIGLMFRSGTRNPK